MHIVSFPLSGKYNFGNYAGNCISKLRELQIFLRSMLPNPSKCIRALTSVILFIHQGTIVPASNSNPVCLGGKVTVSMITWTFIHVTLVCFPLIPLCYFSIFVKLISLLICTANLVYGTAKHTSHQGNHTLFLLQRQCRLLYYCRGRWHLRWLWGTPTGTLDAVFLAASSLQWACG